MNTTIIGIQKKRKVVGYEKGIDCFERKVKIHILKNSVILLSTNF